VIPIPVIRFTDEGVDQVVDDLFALFFADLFRSLSIASLFSLHRPLEIAGGVEFLS
jgi:hypothetical protein